MSLKQTGLNMELNINNKMNSLKVIEDFLQEKVTQKEFADVSTMLPSFIVTNDGFLKSCASYLEDRVKYMYEDGAFFKNSQNVNKKMPSFSELRLASKLLKENEQKNENPQVQVYQKIFDNMSASLNKVGVLEIFKQGRKRVFREGILHEVLNLSMQKQEVELGIREKVDTKDMNKLVATCLLLKKTQPDMYKEIDANIDKSPYKTFFMDVREQMGSPSKEVSKEMYLFNQKAVEEFYPNLMKDLQKVDIFGQNIDLNRTNRYNDLNLNST